MATDSTNVTHSDIGVETDSDMAGGMPDYASVQLAVASGDKPIEVQLPKGKETIRIPVKPGDVVQLPTDSMDGVLAKIGPEGNLAFVIDGRTIILQGYVKANEEKPVTIVTNDGDLIDPADAIASTDPNVALDIVTAAGPAAAGAQAGTDATGSGIFVPFGAAGGLGGFNAEGVLGATALQYKLINDERKFFVHGLEEENHLPQDIKIVPDEGQPTG